jgi:hypothetical protein
VKLAEINQLRGFDRPTLIGVARDLRIPDAVIVNSPTADSLRIEIIVKTTELEEP